MIVTNAGEIDTDKVDVDLLRHPWLDGEARVSMLTSVFIPNLASPEKRCQQCTYSNMIDIEEYLMNPDNEGVIRKRMAELGSVVPIAITRPKRRGAKWAEDGPIQKAGSTDVPVLWVDLEMEQELEEEFERAFDAQDGLEGDEVGEALDAQDGTDGLGEASMETTSKPASVTKTKAKQRKEFFNQLTLTWTDDESRKSVKVFRNLTWHVTGCKTPSDARKVAAFVRAIVCEVYPQHVPVEYTQQVPMANVTFEIRESLNLEKLSKRLMTYLGNVRYSKISKYPGVNAKHPVPDNPKHPTTLLIFASGNVTISGKTGVNILAAFRFMMDFVEKNINEVRSLREVLSKKKQAAGKVKRSYNRKNAREVSEKEAALRWILT
jgi:TATA-box binding protein (TBP) (component of TFIID and TFIIIB)